MRVALPVSLRRLARRVRKIGFLPPTLTESSVSVMNGDATIDDDAIRALVSRLARPHPSGGEVIERAAILADGADFAAVMTWILAHSGIPEGAAAPAAQGLHGSRLTYGGRAAPQAPVRFILPAGALA
jgi:hypothetical protein